ncbi:GntR family transcriptional regulator [Rhizobium sp.]
MAYERLKDIIISGAFPPNEKMTVRSVAAALGVSTTPARDAINRLLNEGALTYTGPKTVVIPNLTMDVLEEVTATRLALETMAGTRAVASITRSDIDQLQTLQTVINRNLDIGRYREVLSANRAFHFLIYNRSNWPRVVSIIEGLWLQVGPSFNALYPDFAISRKGVSSHMMIIDGLKEANPDKVHLGIEQDLRHGFERLSAFVTGTAK